VFVTEVLESIFVDQKFTNQMKTSGAGVTVFAHFGPAEHAISYYSMAVIFEVNDK